MKLIPIDSGRGIRMFSCGYIGGWTFNHFRFWTTVQTKVYRYMFIQRRELLLDHVGESILQGLCQKVGLNRRTG